MKKGTNFFLPRVGTTVLFLVFIFAGGFFLSKHVNLSPKIAHAAGTNWYVRPNAAGSANGTDWNNAWSISNINWASVQPGDTVWLAGGTYSDNLAISKSGTSGNPITIERVLSSDAVPAAAAGWSSSFDSTVNIRGIDDPSSSYIIITGRKASGITITIPAGGGDGVTASEGGSINTLTLQYLEIIGPACAKAGNCSTSSNGINIANSANTVTNLLIDHDNIHNVSETVREASWQNSIVQYNQIHDTFNDGTAHEDIVYTYPFANSGNVTWRYNNIYNSPNDGVFFEYGGAQNFYFYGNVYWNSDVSLMTTKAPGTYGPMYIYNNVFAASSLSACSSNCAFISDNNSKMTGVQLYNNIFLDVVNSFSGNSGETSDYNAYNYTTLNGYPWPSNEAHSFTFTGTPFVNAASGNFRLLSGSVLANKGKALTTDGFINMDMDGNIRGADGAWDVGAYELGGGGTVTPPPSDTTAPTTSISSPVNGSTISGTTLVTASASDNVGVTKVEFYLDGVLQTTDSASPYTWSWNTTSVSNGSHALVAKAYDAAGNVGTSATVNVTVSNTVTPPPPVSSSSISLVQKISSVSTGATSLAVALPFSVTTGDLIVVGLTGWPLPTNMTITDSRGNTYASAGTMQQTGGTWSAIYYAPNVSGGADTITVSNTNSSEQFSVVAAEFSGITTSSPLDAAAGTNGSSANPSSGNMTPTVSGDLLIGAGTHDMTTVTSAGAGLTMAAIATEDSSLHQPGAMDYGVLSNTNSIPATFSLAKSGTWTQNGALFKAASGSSGGSTPPPADTTAPSVSLAAPANNATISGTVSVSATASDNTGVTKVEFYLDGVLQTTDSASPYTWSWNTTSVSNGSHALVAKAYDAAGNVGTSATVNVTVNNVVADTSAPSIPTNLTLSGITKSSITLGWSASTDNVGVTGYNIYRNGTKFTTTNATAYMDTGLSASSTYSYTVSAYDAAGNVSARSGSVSGTTISPTSTPVQDVTPPTTSITSPQSDETVSGAITIALTASDNIGVTSVALYVDGLLKATDASSPYAFTLDTTSLTDGFHSLQSKAYDAAGNVGTSETIRVTVNNETQTPPSSSSTPSSTESSTPPVIIPPTNPLPPSSGGGGGGGGGGYVSPATSLIKSVSVANLTASSAQLVIATTQSASVSVKYGLTTTYGTTLSPSPYLLTTYENLLNLVPNSTYDILITAISESGSIASQTYLITTPPSDNVSVTPVTVPVFTRDLSYGDTGSDVVTLQTLLRSLGFFPVSVSTAPYFGTQTEHALLLFQNAHDLNKSGFVDTQSQALLNKIAAAQNVPVASSAQPTSSTIPTPVTSGTSGHFGRNLGMGSQGDDVTFLQQFLFQDGDYPANIITGYFGSLTQAAVKIFQTKHGIINYGSPATTGYGAVGPKTRGALNGL